METGHWNRKGRSHLLAEEHLCSCGQIQTERHVVEACPLTDNTRQVYNMIRLKDLFKDNISIHKTCAIFYEIRDTFKWLCMLPSYVMYFMCLKCFICFIYLMLQVIYVFFYIFFICVCMCVFGVSYLNKLFCHSSCIFVLCVFGIFYLLNMF